MSDYTFLIHKASEGGFWVEVPALPGCLSQGETMDEAVANIQEAIESHIIALREDGQDVPEEDGLLVGRVAVAG